jgi:hypothetical protein
VVDVCPEFDRDFSNDNFVNEAVFDRDLELELALELELEEEKHTKCKPLFHEQLELEIALELEREEEKHTKCKPPFHEQHDQFIDLVDEEEEILIDQQIQPSVLLISSLEAIQDEYPTIRNSALRYQLPHWSEPDSGLVANGAVKHLVKMTNTCSIDHFFVPLFTLMNENETFNQNIITSQKPAEVFLKCHLSTFNRMKWFELRLDWVKFNCPNFQIKDNTINMHSSIWEMNIRFIKSNLEMELICSQCRNIDQKTDLPPISMVSHDPQNTLQEDVITNINKKPMNQKISTCHSKPLCCGAVKFLETNYLYIDTISYTREIKTWNEIPETITMFEHTFKKLAAIFYKPGHFYSVYKTRLGIIRYDDLSPSVKQYTLVSTEYQKKSNEKLNCIVYIKI